MKVSLDASTVNTGCKFSYDGTDYTTDFLLPTSAGTIVVASADDGRQRLLQLGDVASDGEPYNNPAERRAELQAELDALPPEQATPAPEQPVTDATGVTASTEQPPPASTEQPPPPPAPVN